MLEKTLVVNWNKDTFYFLTMYIVHSVQYTLYNKERNQKSEQSRDKKICSTYSIKLLFLNVSKYFFKIISQPYSKLGA